MATATEERYIKPRVNVREDAHEVTIEAELPGVSKNEAEIEVRDGHLILKGKRSPKGEGRYRVQERHDSSFYRAFALSDAIDTEHVEARIKDGVLTVTLQKVDRLRPKSIPIT